MDVEIGTSIQSELVSTDTLLIESQVTEEENIDISSSKIKLKSQKIKKRKSVKNPILKLCSVVATVPHDSPVLISSHAIQQPSKIVTSNKRSSGRTRNRVVNYNEEYEDVSHRSNKKSLTSIVSNTQIQSVHLSSGKKFYIIILLQI